MVEAMLEPHLKDAGATQTQVGLSFLITGALYMCTTPVAGYVNSHSFLSTLSLYNQLIHRYVTKYLIPSWYQYLAMLAWL